MRRQPTASRHEQPPNKATGPNGQSHSYPQCQRSEVGRQKSEVSNFLSRFRPISVFSARNDASSAGAARISLPTSVFRLPAPAPGGANRDRTGDLLLAKQALSQLSYGPGIQKSVIRKAEVSEARTKPDASDFCLPTSDFRHWWAREDLNFRPHAYQARALTS